LVITVFSTVILMIYMGTFRQMAGVAADPVVELGLVRNPSPLVHSILALILLMAATILGVYKPFGLTPYGLGRPGAPVRTVSPAARPDAVPTSWWPYLFAVLAITIIALFLLLHLTGAMPAGH
jgi:hypothetical protein